MAKAKGNQPRGSFNCEKILEKIIASSSLKVIQHRCQQRSFSFIVFKLFTYFFLLCCYVFNVDKQKSLSRNFRLKMSIKKVPKIASSLMLITWRNKLLCFLRVYLNNSLNFHHQPTPLPPTCVA